MGADSDFNFEIEKKYFNFYEGTSDIFYVEEFEIFLSLCNRNIYAFKIENEKNYLFPSDICYPTCVLESSVDMEDIKETYHKKYLNKFRISLFSNINYFAVFKNDVFLGTDDYNLHQYRLIVSEKEEEEEKEDKNPTKEYINGTEATEDILLYDVEEKEGNNIYCYNFNWAYLRKVHIWKSINSIVSCFNLSEGSSKNFVVGYNSGNINLYNLEKYKLRLTYRIHNNRISCLKIYKDFIISADVTKHIYIYNWKEGKTMFSLDDHVSGINSFHFLRAQNSNSQLKKEKNGEHKNEMGKKKGKEISSKDEEEDRIIGLVSVGNDKIINIWNLEMLNEEKSGDTRTLSELDKESPKDKETVEEGKIKKFESVVEDKKLAKRERKKQRRKNRYANTEMCKPIQQLLLSNDINDALIIPVQTFEKSKYAIKKKNVKWVILVHDEKGTLYVYDPVEANVLFQLKRSKKKVNKSNICKFFLIRDELYLFREDCSILMYDINKWKLKNNYLTKIEGIFEMLFLNSYSEKKTQHHINKNSIIDKKEAEKKNREDGQKTEANNGIEKVTKEETDTEMEMEVESANEKNIDEYKAVILIGDNFIRIVEMKNLIKQKMLIGHEDVVTSIKFSEKHNILFSGSNDKNILVWNLQTCECIYILKDNMFTINAIDINLKKYPTALVASVCEDNSLKMWKFTIELEICKQRKRKRKLEEYLDHDKITEDEPNGNEQDKEMLLKGPKEVHSTISIYSHNTWINDVVIAPNGKLVVTCSKDKTVKVYDTQHMKLLATLEGHKKPVQNIFFSPNQSTLFSVSYDCVRIWDMQTYECIKNIQSLQFNITSVLLCNENYLINGYSNGNINMVHLNTCEQIGTTNYHEDKIFCLKKCCDYIISASVNGEILFLKNKNEGHLKQDLKAEQKKIFYENCLERLLENRKVNESLLICLKMDKKFKFKTIIETYLNHYIFEIVTILRDWEMEVVKETTKNEHMIKTENTERVTNYSNETEKKGSVGTDTQDYLQKAMDECARNYLENSDYVTGYIYEQLENLEKEEAAVRENVNERIQQKKENIVKEQENLKKEIKEQIRKLEMQSNDENFVHFLKKIKEKSEHSYYLYLNKLIEFITFFITNHKYAYIATFLLNSILIYVDYEEVCKINNYQHFFEIYNSYLPRHKNRYLHFLQKAKCFQFININFYKGDIGMMK